jgi:tryptophan synthase alpha chain
MGSSALLDTMVGANAIPDDVLAYLDRVRAASSVPVCAGFGIRNAEQVRRLAGHADGVIVGSALINVIEQGGDAGAFLNGLRG